jgi:1,4-dihydroxy-2-naphthoate octaprenyltransferase
MKLKDYAKVIRGKFLILSSLITFTAISLAIYEGIFNIFHSLLGFLVLVLFHISVNSLNVARDYKSGIDVETEKTPFSGGVKVLSSGTLGYESAVFVVLLSLAMSLPIFAYFGLKFDPWIVSTVFLSAFILVVGYTDVFAKILMGEISAGIGLGTLPVLSIFFFQKGTFSPTSLFVSASMFIPTFNLLLLNEFPDIKVDRRHGRKNIPIVLGRKNAVRMYQLSNLIFILTIISLVILGFIPVFTAFSTIPDLISMKIGRKISKNNYNVNIQHMKSNTILTHSIFLFTGLSLILSSIT